MIKFKKCLPWLAIAFLTTCNQTCMKFLADGMAHQTFGLMWVEKAFLSPWAAGILFFEISSFFLWMNILSTVDVGRAVPITSISYILVSAVSFFVFHENISTVQIIGMALILTGIGLISREEVQIPNNQILNPTRG